MPSLVLHYANHKPETFPLGRLRITLGRSARNDLCVPDPFASRVHAEVRRDGDEYVLQDLGSANGTYYNGGRVAAGVRLSPGSRIRIGETEIEFQDEQAGAAVAAAVDHAPLVDESRAPLSSATISLQTDRTTSGILEAIEGARTLPSVGRDSNGSRTALPTASAQAASQTQSDLLALISKVGVTLLASATLDETLKQIAALVFEAVPAERCLIMLRDEPTDKESSSSKADASVIADARGELKVRVAQTRNASNQNVAGASVSSSGRLTQLNAQTQMMTAVNARTSGQTSGQTSQPLNASVSSSPGEVRVSRSIIEETVERGRSVLTADAQQDPRFAGSTVAFQGVRAVLAVPLGVGSENFGLIYADSPLQESNFTEDHLKVLTTLASVAAIRVENARLLEGRLERERLEQELYLAREIQQRFQPAAPPQIPGYEMQGISFPCYEIGGDYYDFIECPDGRLLIALGDVSGKGTSAALLMSSLHAAMHAQVASCRSLVDTVSAVNDYLAENIPANRFVTLFVAELNRETGALGFLNAGHNPPLVAHADGTLEQLAAGGLPLGIKSGFEFTEGRTQLNHGDVLVIYSDGVSETVNRLGEEFGTSRLAEVVQTNAQSNAAGLRDRIEGALTKFAQGAHAADDVTMVIVKRN